MSPPLHPFPQGLCICSATWTNQMAPISLRAEPNLSPPPSYGSWYPWLICPGSFMQGQQRLPAADADDHPQQPGLAASHQLLYLRQQPGKICRACRNRSISSSLPPPGYPPFLCVDFWLIIVGKDIWGSSAVALHHRPLHSTTARCTPPPPGGSISACTKHHTTCMLGCLEQMVPSSLSRRGLKAASQHYKIPPCTYGSLHSVFYSRHACSLAIVSPAHPGCGFWGGRTSRGFGQLG